MKRFKCIFFNFATFIFILFCICISVSLANVFYIHIYIYIYILCQFDILSLLFEILLFAYVLVIAIKVDEELLPVWLSRPLGKNTLTLLSIVSIAHRANKVHHLLVRGSEGFFAPGQLLWGLRAMFSKSVSQLRVKGFIRVLTVASWNSEIRGPCTRVEVTEGSQLSPHILISSPFPTLPLVPQLITPHRSFKILFQA